MPQSAMQASSGRGPHLPASRALPVRSMSFRAVVWRPGFVPRAPATSTPRCHYFESGMSRSGSGTPLLSTDGFDVVEIGDLVFYHRGDPLTVGGPFDSVEHLVARRESDGARSPAGRPPVSLWLHDPRSANAASAARRSASSSTDPPSSS